MSSFLIEFLKEWVASGLATEDEARGILAQYVPRATSAEELAEALIAGRELTPFQARRILRQQGASLKLGNYLLIDLLGKGSMGVVYQARHRRMDRIVALKVLPARLSQKPGLIERFQREVKAVARLSHPNIVVAHDADEVDGVNYYVMEYVDGMDLATLVKRNGVMSVQQAADLIRQAARGLGYAHDHKVVHRDVKPANLLLDTEGQLKILDMGLARIEDEIGKLAELTGSGLIVGTVDFMSPEQGMNTHSADARSDIYSLGATLWNLLTAKPLYGGETLTQRMHGHQNSPIPSLRDARPDVPEWLELIFRRMVAKRPDDRYQSMSEVVTALDRRDSPVEMSVAPGPSPELTRLVSQTRQREVEGEGKAIPRVDRDKGGAMDESTLLGLGTLGSEILSGDPMGSTRIAVRYPQRVGGLKPAIWLFAAGGVVAVVVLGYVLRDDRSSPSTVASVYSKGDQRPRKGVGDSTRRPPEVKGGASLSNQNDGELPPSADSPIFGMADLVSHYQSFRLSGGQEESVRIDGNTLKIDCTGGRPQVWIDFWNLGGAHVAVESDLRIETEGEGHVKFVLMDDLDLEDYLIIDEKRGRRTVGLASAVKNRPLIELTNPQAWTIPNGQVVKVRFEINGGTLTGKIDGRTFGEGKNLPSGRRIALAVQRWKVEFINPRVIIYKK